MLPKVGLLGDKKREKKYDVRARIEMKNGKLNLSQFNDWNEFVLSFYGFISIAFFFEYIEE